MLHWVPKKDSKTSAHRDFDSAHEDLQESVVARGLHVPFSHVLFLPIITIYEASDGLNQQCARWVHRSSTRKPSNSIKSLIFTNTPCKSTCLYNAPSLHIAEITLGLRNVMPYMRDDSELSSHVMSMQCMLLICHIGVVHCST